MSRVRWFIVAGLAVALLLAGGVSFYASSQPDGLEKVASEQGFLDTADEHDLAGSPLADYSVADIDNARLSVGLAGVIGVALTFGAGVGVFVLVRRRD